ncbi:protein phosphatase 1 regulatory subunit 37 [Tachysurus fulvidraco]|uniref:protein phosphatase 1 regulatory subunit 37 n=1 Tax=Tachysurus fulvidraco TaxID=1234273 RepID=UPI000F4E81DD|nr:protein phosphatase 1 regulatory subunit 37 [Tachysurus fulvidraco]
MNLENQALDLCKARMKASDDDHSSAFISEELHNSIKFIDKEAEGPDSGHEDKSDKEELLKNNGTFLSVPSHIPEESSTQETESVRSVNDDEDMDIGVDLSLDESGVLEPDPVTVLVGSHSAASVVSDRDKHRGETLEGDPTSSTDAEASSPSLSSDQQEGAGPKPGGKRVTFPPDKDIVSGSVEPKDPWRHAQNVTVEEILNAYRQSCQKVNCKPIPKVLKQIQELTDLTQRNDCLDLKGEKLDYRACESLEEIFKRVQFKVVDLEQTNLDEDGASALFDMIEYYESATHLNISFNKHIGTRGWQAASHMMRKTSSLQYLDARCTPLLDHSAPFVARALRISGSLTVLHLENAGLSGRPLMLLATALKMNMNLRELYLADNKLNGLQDSAQLGNLLKFNYNIHILDLRNNHILDSGLAYICEGLKEQRKGLVTLVLWNNQLTHNGMGYLASALPCTQSLETLNLGHNAVGNEGVLKLKDGLIANRSLLRLGLASTKLSCEGAVAVAEFFAESPRLLRLDLRENEIKTGGLMALSLALKVNTSLLRLDLDREPKKETVKSFIETQRTLLTEIQNGCKRNFILAKEKEESQQQMRQSVSMAEIATEDPPPEEEEDAGGQVSEGEKTKHEEDMQEVEESEKPCEVREDEEQTSATQDDSDSDTDTDDDENEDATVTQAAAQTSTLNQTPPSVNTTLSACKTPPINIPTSTPKTVNVMSGVRVTEANVSSGTPSSPGRCISVSSPGRGHKIFMVTRVESPPEQQEQQQQSVLLKHVQDNKTPLSGMQPVAQDLQSADRTTSAQETSEEPSQISTEPKPGETGPLVSTTEAQPSTHSQTQQELNPSTELEKETTIEEIVHTEHAQIHHTAPAEPEELQHAEDMDKEPSSSDPTGELQKEFTGHLDAQTPNDDQQLDKNASQEQDLKTLNSFSSADEVKSLDTAPPTGTTLPNGLKPEFSLHLLEPEAHKAACCVMEHMSVTAELSCGQDLEELLLDASLDASRDAP